jgi:hypothetical protein
MYWSARSELASDVYLPDAEGTARPGDTFRFQRCSRLGAMFNLRLKSARVVSPRRTRPICSRLNWDVKMRRPSDLRGKRDISNSWRLLANSHGFVGRERERSARFELHLIAIGGGHDTRRDSPTNYRSDDRAFSRMAH